MSHLLATPHGIALAGVMLAKRNPNGTFNIRGREKEIHAQLQAAYGKAVTPQAMRYVERGCELLAKVSDKKLEEAAYPFHPNPHAKTTSGNDFSDLTKGLMMFALTGLNDMENIPEGKARLLKMQASAHHDNLLKSYGLPTWAELAKDDGDDEDDEDEDDEGDDSDDSGASAGVGNSHYNPDEPRIPAGQPGGGQWTTGGNGVSSDSGSISADEVRNDPTDDVDQTARNRFTNEIISTEDSTNDMLSTPVPVTRGDGTVVTWKDGTPIMMPESVSLQANIDLGEKIASWPSMMTGDVTFNGPIVVPDLEMDPNATPAKELEMFSQFAPGEPMDYQRMYPIMDSNGTLKPNPIYVDFGNYNFGVVAAAARYSLDQAVFVASLVNARNMGNPYVDTSDPWGGNPRNNYFIRQGYNDYISGKIKSSGK